ncbi:hypothetical protein GBAR_LOCUS21847 [Geodia barretti]|uniref:Uncharacterized protein n=1 Tax=Geodia barretti TaxID=519541 RepID=A0AA35T145_GEOBA|nr:hypothetical protein GBAR_LOCUS21847 [Geodia barretti]
MSVVRAESDVSNPFLSRREIVCSFANMSGRLGKMKATEMVTEELGLGGKLVIPILLKNQVGRTDVKGTFYVYDDEDLARKHINPSIMTRFDKARKAAEGASE